MPPEFSKEGLMCERGAYEDDARILVFRGEILEAFSS
jgi:hypothetical protein